MRIFNFIVILIALSACNVFNLKEYSISGNVLDKFGQGVDSVAILYGESDTAYTNVDGYFFLQELRKEQTITLEKDGYTFSPESMTITAESDSLSFTASRTITEEETLLINWFNNLQRDNGLLESTDNGNIVSLYDNALSALVFMSYGDFERAEKVFDFFNSRIEKELLNGKGGYSQFRDRYGNPNNHKWLGDNAWLLMALNNYKMFTGKSTYDKMTSELENWIRSLQDTDGGIWGGYEANGARIGKVTEGNIDAFNAVTGFDDFHTKLLDYLQKTRWNGETQSLEAWPGNNKYLYALDVHPWSYCALENFPENTLNVADQFITTITPTVLSESITGFCFDADKDCIWLEGTGEMVVAFNKAHQYALANYYLEQMAKMFVESKFTDGVYGIPYATNVGTGYGSGALWTGADKNPAISSTAWYLFGKNHFDPFRAEYSKGIPTENQFWK